MPHLKVLLILILSMIFTASRGQSITNVHFETSGKQIIISYDLVGETKTKCAINLFFAINNGPWQGPLKSVTGDVGTSQKAGIDKKIVWNVLDDLGDFSGEGSFKVQGEIQNAEEYRNPKLGKDRGVEILCTLEGRDLLAELTKPDYPANDFGTVVVTINVNNIGEVVSAIPGAKGTTTTNSWFWEVSRKSALTAKFNMINGKSSPNYQKGTIIYKYTIY